MSTMLQAAKDKGESSHQKEEYTKARNQKRTGNGLVKLQLRVW